MSSLKIARLIEITTLLLGRRTVTARELAERFAVSVRTVYRDVEALSAAGIPVYMSKGHGGGISLLEKYTLSKTLLSDQEKSDILLALKTLEATRYPDIDKILAKFTALFSSPPADDWLAVDFARWGSDPQDQQKFQALKQAIVGRQVVAFDYVNTKGERGNRAVEPLKLLYKGTAWYLAGYCRKRGDHRLFRLSRLKNPVVTGELFTPEAPADWERQLMETAPPLIPLKLRFQDKVLSRLCDDFADTAIIRQADGTLAIETALPENEWLYGYLLSYGNCVEVLEPAHVRRKLTNRIEKTLALYQNINQI